MKITKKQAAPVVNRTFPEYGGRKFKIEFVEKITVYDTNWDGGTCNKYAAINADGSASHFIAPAPWKNFGLGGRMTWKDVAGHFPSLVVDEFLL